MPPDDLGPTAPAAPLGGPGLSPEHAAGPLAQADTPAPSQADQLESPPSGAASTLFKDLPDAEQRYKALQSHFTRLTQRLSPLGAHGSLDQIQSNLALFQALRQDPTFQTWARAQLAQQTTGANDPETLRALQIVEQVAERKARELVEPVQERARMEQMYGTVSAVAQKYGADWSQYQEAVKQELDAGIQAGIYPEEMNWYPTPEFLERLYLIVRSQDPNYGARQHQQRLQQLKAQQTQSQAGTAPSATAGPRANSLDEAFQAAKRELGLS